MTKLIQESKILSFAESEFKNPYLKYVKFVFADDKPNMNQQAIPYEEFANLKASAIGMPIKMRFLGRRGGVGNHEGSIPIGHISDVIEDITEDGTHRLVAEGALYANEYPDIIEYLEETYEEAEAPGLSWELSYKEGVVEKGITWLKGVIARAATFVKHPAYGKRTALLALASMDTTAAVNDPELRKQLLDILDDLKEVIDGSGSDTEEEDDEEETTTMQMSETKGGNTNVNLEEALARIAELETELTAKAAEIETLTTTASRVEELETENAGLKDQVAGFQKSALIEDRTRRAVEAGVVLETDEEKLAQKQELWIAMSEEIFNEFISTVAAVAAKVPERKAEASVKPVLSIPKVSVDTARNGSVDSLRDRMRALSRTEEPAE